MMIVYLRRFLRSLALVAAGCLPLAAHADYTYTLVNYPGAEATQLWGINNAGQIVGAAQTADGTNIKFIYDLKSGAFSGPLAEAPAGTQPAGLTSLIGINSQGTMVGSVVPDLNTGSGTGALRDKKGGYTYAGLPGYLSTQFRSINEAGVCTGFAQSDTGTIGLLYDSKQGVFTTFLPSDLTISHGINSRGEVAGSVLTPNGLYAFFRGADGGLTMFQIAGRPTRARGINDAGQIAGDFRPVTGGNVAFVSRAGGSGQELLSIPGVRSTVAEGIDNAGVVVGIADNTSGFIATPVKGKP